MYGKKGKSKKYNGMAMQPAERGMKVTKYKHGGKVQYSKLHNLSQDKYDKGVKEYKLSSKMKKGSTRSFSDDTQGFDKQPS